MPTAPMGQRSIVDAPVPNVRVGAVAPPQYYGSGIADTVASAGVRMYDLENRAANHTAVFEADRQLADHQTQLENQLYQTKGKQALGADQALLSAYDAKVEELDSSLSNDQQRGMFRHASAVRRQQLNDVTQKYVRNEYGNYQDADTKATLESAKDRVRQQPDNPAVLRGEFTRASQAVDAFAQRKGLSGPVTQEMVNDPGFQKSYEDKGLPVPAVGQMMYSQAAEQASAQVFSGMHTEVINGLLAQEQDQAAAAHLKKYKSNMTAGDLDHAERAVEEGSTRGESRRLVGSLMTKYGGGETVDQQKQILADIDALPDSKAKVADLARQRALHVFSVGKEQRSEAYTNQFMAMSKQMDQTWQQSPVKFARDMFAPNVWNSMKPDDQHALETKLARLRDPNSPHDAGRWLDFSALSDEKLATVTPQDLLKNYLNSFDPTHYDRAITQWQAAREKANKGEKEPKFLSALTPREMIMNRWKESGIVDNSIPRSKWTKEDEANFSRFEDMASRALSAFPKDAKPEEIQKVLKTLSDQNLSLKYNVDPGFFSRNKQVPAIGMGEIDTTKMRSVKIPMEQIPADRQDQIKGLITLGGKAITSDKIERIYALQNLLNAGQLTKDAAKAQMKAIILE